jgi:hypothetical protein
MVGFMLGEALSTRRLEMEALKPIKLVLNPNQD